MPLHPKLMADLDDPSIAASPGTKPAPDTSRDAEFAARLESEMECYPAPGYKMRRGRRCTDRSSDLRCHLIPSDHPRPLQTKCIDLGGDAVQPECGNFGHFHKRGLCNECATWFNVEAGTFIQPEARRLCEENRVNVGSGWNFVDGLELPSPFTAIAERPPLIGDCILSLDDMEGWQHNSFGWVVDACPRTQTVTAAMGSLCGGEVFVMPRHSFVILERAKLMHASAQRGDGGAGRAATLSAWARAPSSPPSENGDPWPHHEDLDKLGHGAGDGALVVPRARLRQVEVGKTRQAVGGGGKAARERVAREVEVLQKGDALDEDRDYQPRTLEQVYARAAVVARAHFRACVHRWLEREKQEPELRKERTSIFEDKKYARCNFVDKHACIIDALREMGECLCRRPGDASCEMCLADKTGASSGQSGTSVG